eukprot:Nk52_evm2s1020 gene=Nk52_evmTU2s1020
MSNNDQGRDNNLLGVDKKTPAKRGSRAKRSLVEQLEGDQGRLSDTDDNYMDAEEDLEHMYEEEEFFDALEEYGTELEHCLENVIVRLQTRWDSDVEFEEEGGESDELEDRKAGDWEKKKEEGQGISPRRASARTTRKGASSSPEEWVKALFDKQKGLLKQSAEQLKAKKKEMQDRLNQRKTELNRRINEPRFLLFREKVAFFGGVVNLLITELIWLEWPHMMWLWYTIWIIPLLGLRYYLYHQSKYHYFMLDFCYFAQCLLLFFIFVYPGSLMLFYLVFSITNGSLMWAVLAWRNSLVFHDLDKMTSSFIHLFPALVTHCIRWYPHPGRANFGICYHTHERENVDFCPGTMSFRDYVIVPMVVYAVWQISYIMKTEFVDKMKFQKDVKIQTSFRWLSQSQGHPVYRICSKFPPKYRLYVFCAIQMLFTAVTSLPTKYFFESFVLHTCFVIFVTLTAIWNGAGYYIVFLNKKKTTPAVSISNDPQVKESQLANGAGANKKSD